MTEKTPDFVCFVRKIRCFFAGKGYAGRLGDVQPSGLCKAEGRFAKQIAPVILGAKAMGETNKHPPHFVRVVRLVSLRGLSNDFDSLRTRPFCLCEISAAHTAALVFFLPKRSTSASPALCRITVPPSSAPWDTMLVHWATQCMEEESSKVALR